MRLVNLFIMPGRIKNLPFAVVPVIIKKVSRQSD